MCVRIPSGLCGLWVLTNAVIAVYTEQSLSAYNLSEHRTSKVATCFSVAHPGNVLVNKLVSFYQEFENLKVSPAVTGPTFCVV